jgi:hypothetical protein
MRGGLTPAKPKRKAPTKRKASTKAKRPPKPVKAKAPGAKRKPAKRKPRASAARKAKAAADSDEWVREYRLTLAACARSLRDNLGKMTPLEVIGAMKALSEAVNDRDAILDAGGEP